MIPFDNTYARLPERFFTRQSPARVPAPALIRLNPALAATLRIDGDWLTSAEGEAMLAGNTTPDGAEPIAQAYAGHQFGGFVPQLGDGRAILIGEVVDPSGARYDLQLKGSGRTPFSRGGDGKAALGPVLREYVISEAMAALGVPTTRALAAVATGELVPRQEGPLAGGVFTRVAASHIRVGTFQYFLARNDIDGIRLLADHVIARHYPQASEMANPHLALLESVVAAQADLIAQWMSVGFIHGVMNTDNMAISGETIDYGPCAFMDVFHPRCVFSSIDRGARYAYGNQPDIGLWNLTRFAETLLPLLSDDVETAKGQAEAVLSGYPARFGVQATARFRAKLGLPAEAPAELIQECLDLLAAEEADFTLFFRQLTRVAAGEASETIATMCRSSEAFNTWFAAWRHAADPAAHLADMRAANPILIPRNHRVEHAIQRGYAGDFAPFHRLVEALAAPYAEQSDYADLEAPPRPEEVVQETFCGT
ncbi:MAG: YdiU family protein [Acidobacteria bacterium]|nr:YdiU family protein [Acidobacteriota bacterium]